VVIQNTLPGLLLNAGLAVRTTITMNNSVSMDSTNQPVRNCSGVVLRSRISTPKVMSAKTELIQPKRIMKLRMNLTS